MKVFDYRNHPTLLSAILLIVAGILLNVVPARLALALGIPLYLDCTGTIITAMLGGNLPAVIVGFASNAINGISEPETMYYGVISILIAAVATFYYHQRFFTNIPRLFVVIVSFAIIGGGIGSLFTYFLYGLNFGQGVTAPFANAFHEVFGYSKFVSQLLADIIIDVFDKGAVVVAAVFLFRFIPRRLKNHLNKVFLRDSSNSHAKKTVKHSLLHKVVVLVIFAQVLLGALACTIGFYLYRDNSIKRFVDIATGVTEAASRVVDGNRVEEYIAMGDSAEEYKHVKSILYGIRESFPQTKFLYVYKIERDGCHVVFDLDAEGQEGGYAGEIIPFDPSFEPYLPTLFAGGTIDPIISDDQFGWLLTVYTPLKNSSGRTVAYVAADIDMTEISADEAMFFIKMLSLGGKTKDHMQNVRALHTIPVAISYEYDPCDYLKAAEFQLKRDNPEWKKTKADDVKSMATGLMGYKGRIRYTFTSELNGVFDQYPWINDRNAQVNCVCETIDNMLHEAMVLYPINYVAYDLKYQTDRYKNQKMYTEADKTKAAAYLNGQLAKVDIPNRDEAFLWDMLLTMYSNPVFNKEKLSRERDTNYVPMT